jgi:hypothetical protein
MHQDPISNMETTCHNVSQVTKFQLSQLIEDKQIVVNFNYLNIVINRIFTK